VFACLQTAQDSLVKTTTLNPRRASWGMRAAAPVDSIVVGEAIVVILVLVIFIIVITVVIVVVSRNAAAEEGVSGAIPPLSLLLSSAVGVAAVAVALSLIPWPLNVRRSIIVPSHPDRFAAPFPYHRHRPPVCAPPLPSFAASRPS